MADANSVLLQTLIATGLSKIGADVPTAQSLMRLAVTLAQDANKFQGLKGADRLALVLSALREVLTTTAITQKIPPEALKALREVVDSVIPETITLVVAASRGGFDLKRPSVGCIAAFVALFCRTVAATAPAGSQIAQIAAASQAVASTVAAATPAEEKEKEKETISPAAVTLQTTTETAA
jgi:hypothetical protein